MLEVNELCKTFTGSDAGKRRKINGRQSNSDVLAIDHVSFTVEAGEVFTLLGPSGCGKSTTLRAIAGLEQPDSGVIRIAGRTVFSPTEGVRLPPNERLLSMVFQSYAIWPHMNVFGNVAFPLEVRRRRQKLSRKQIRERVEQALDAVQLGGLADRPAVKLSGGQQQRLALARALATDPELILLDEPLSNLDAKLRESMRMELKRLQSHLGLTSVYVTHDQGEALALSSRIAVMNQGKIVQIGKPREIYESPQCKFVAEFIGTSNVIPGTVCHVDNETAQIETPHGMISSSSWLALKAGDEVLLIVRPEDVRLHDAHTHDLRESGWKGRVLAGAYLGEAIDYVVAVDSIEMRCRANPSEARSTDTDVMVTIDPDRVHVLAADSAA